MKPWLHGAQLTLRTVIQQETSSEMLTPSAPPMETVFLGNVTYQETRRRRAMLQVVPIRIQAGTRRFDTYAFLDSGSDTTMIRIDIAKSKLGLSGWPIISDVAGFDGKSETSNGKTRQL